MESVGGYSLIRKLGSGERADVYLGVAHRGEISAIVSEQRVAAIKRYRQSTDRHSIDAEMSAIGRISSPHVVRLLDVTTEPVGDQGDGRLYEAGPCLILQRLVPAGLARFLSDRSSIEPGEAVTILAPIAGAIAELHRSGVSHGDLRASNILFDDSGAPVLAGFGHATVFWDRDEASSFSCPTAAELSVESSVIRDLEQLTVLTCSVVNRIRGVEVMSAARELLAWLHPTGQAQIGDGFAERLADRLFDLAPALPLRIAPPTLPQAVGTGLPLRLAMNSADSSGSSVENAASPAERDWISVFHLPDWLRDAIVRQLDKSQIAAIGLKLKKTLGRVRKPVWFAAALTGALLLIVFAAIPTAGEPVASVPNPSPSLSSVSRTAAIPSSADQAAVRAKRETLAGDDPVAALWVLLEQRSRCIQNLSLLCLEQVDQIGSAAMDADGTAIRAREKGGAASPESAITAQSIRLINRMGESALLGVDLDQHSAPRGTSALGSSAQGASAQGAAAQNAAVSILLVKVKLEWRIRDILIAAG